MTEVATGKICPICGENPAEVDSCSSGGGWICECCARCRAYCEEDENDG